ncbi:MAG: tail-specific protease, partial [Flavobacterium sp.]
TRDVRLLIDTLKNLDKVDAIVMDLRANGGGSLNEAIELTGLFIDKGPVVQVRDYRNSITVDEDKEAGTAWNGPFGVMIDRVSASASEIFAGAIQDYGRGLIMGTQSYGKGTVQRQIALNDMVDPSILQKMMSMLASSKNKEVNEGKVTTKENGKTVTVKQNSNHTTIVDKDGVPQLGQLNLTMGKFYRISGNSNQHKGIIPDFNFPSIYPLDKIGEDTEPSALPFDVIKPSNYKPLENLGPVKASLTQRHKERMAQSLDYKILQEDIIESKKREGETSITLNEAKLKAERDDLEAKSLARVNKLRASRGLAPIKKGDKSPKEDTFDFVQQESLNIMVDFMKMNQSDKTAQDKNDFSTKSYAT